MVKRHPKIVKMHSESSRKLEVLKAERKVWDRPLNPAPEVGYMDLDAVIRTRVAEVQAEVQGAVPMPASSTSPPVKVVKKSENTTLVNAKSIKKKEKPAPRPVSAPLPPQAEEKATEHEAPPEQRQDHSPTPTHEGACSESRPRETRNFGPPPPDFITSVRRTLLSQTRSAPFPTLPLLPYLSHPTSPTLPLSPLLPIRQVDLRWAAYERSCGFAPSPSSPSRPLDPDPSQPPPTGILRTKPQPELVEALVLQQLEQQAADKLRRLQRALQESGLSLFSPDHPYVTATEESLPTRAARKISRHSHGSHSSSVCGARANPSPNPTYARRTRGGSGSNLDPGATGDDDAAATPAWSPSATAGRPPPSSPSMGQCSLAELEVMAVAEAVDEQLSRILIPSRQLVRHRVHL